MPIRHCQKCGLKVLIDESQAGANPFYCQRCTTAMKSSDAPEVAVSPNTPVKREVPQAVSPAPSAVAQTPPPGPGMSRATVKVLCPYCKASFNGRVPQKPARGACPVCQKELILLPNGDIRQAEGFDIGKWQQEIAEAPAGRPSRSAPEPEPVAVGGPPTPPPAPPKEGGTRLLIKKYAAEPEAPAPASAKADTGTRLLSRKQAEPTPVPVTAPPEPPPAELPDWLNDAPKAGKPATDDLLREKDLQRDPARTEDGDEAASDATAAAAPPVDEPLDEPARPKFSAKQPPAVVRPPPPPPAAAEPKPATVTRKPGTVRRSTDRRAAADLAPAGATGGGKVFVAWLLLLLPLAACPVLLKSREKFKGTVVEKLGGMFQRGFLALYKKLAPPPEAPKPKVEEKKPEAPPEKPPADPEEQKRDEAKLIKLYEKINRLSLRLKNDTVGKTPEELKAFEPAQAELKKEQDEYDRLGGLYERTYGTKFKPE